MPLKHKTRKDEFKPRLTPLGNYHKKHVILRKTIPEPEEGQTKL